MTADKNGAKKALYRFDKNYPLREKLLPGQQDTEQKKGPHNFANPVSEEVQT